MTRKARGFLIASGIAIGLSGFAFLLPRSRAEQPTTGPAIPEKLSVVAFSPVEAGRYLVQITGCNECHTPGWMQAPGSAPESMWLTGVPVGFMGPWGTSYPSNLRRFVKDFNADTWVAVIRSRNQKPPMPWAQLHAMSDADLRAIFEYIKSLGPGGDVSPADTGPSEEPKTPYFLFVPQVSEVSGVGAKTALPTTQK